MSDWTLGKILRRSILYLALALASLVVVSLILAISIHTGIVITGGWIGLVGFTGLLLWVSISHSREYWRR